MQVLLLEVFRQGDERPVLLEVRPEHPHDGNVPALQPEIPPVAPGGRQFALLRKLLPGIGLE